VGVDELVTTYFVDSRNIILSIYYKDNFIHTIVVICKPLNTLNGWGGAVGEIDIMTCLLSPFFI